ncbi:MAG: heavy-metal-associated domain-containing protein [Winogradskyella sp.]|uniref:heavy-metal-associated domain-containing protein n=1 Tax=Winogradskyella sp. TaxID=1883156 RepID=UPI00179E2699|nr:heavy-metal-associated domain-containing protein [Winogradskyella sp.]MBT8244454.1 heavy-metal-associated domain-containing protein [Winogradskyella sp.]NNK22406.1 heavy-metal-associated domain-containing protein [Winogradskyella sp.]
MRTTVHIKNLECCGCAKTIENTLSKIKNVSEVIVDFNKETVTFNFHTKHDFDMVKYVLSRIGYPIVGKESRLIN